MQAGRTAEPRASERILLASFPSDPALLLVAFPRYRSRFCKCRVLSMGILRRIPIAESSNETEA